MSSLKKGNQNAYKILVSDSYDGANADVGLGAVALNKGNQEGGVVLVRPKELQQKTLDDVGGNNPKGLHFDEYGSHMVLTFDGKEMCSNGHLYITALSSLAGIEGKDRYYSPVELTMNGKGLGYVYTPEQGESTEHRGIKDVKEGKNEILLGLGIKSLTRPWIFDVALSSGKLYESAADLAADLKKAKSKNQEPF